MSNVLRWLTSRFAMAPVNRVAAVTFDADTLDLQWARGSTASITWDEIQSLLIRTTDGGPFDEDVFFILNTSDNSYVIPQEAIGAGEMLGRFQQLPGFDNKAVIASMGCAENKDFLCWNSKSAGTR